MIGLCINCTDQKNVIQKCVCSQNKTYDILWHRKLDIPRRTADAINSLRIYLI